MVNTVGSYKSKFWNKKWRKIKRSLVLSTRQEDIIFGSLLGDGTMRIGKDAKNANFKVEHGLAQKKYVFWKYESLKDFVFTEPKISFRYRDDGCKYPKSWWFRTIRHPLLTRIYEMFYAGERYRTGRKVVPKVFKGRFSPLSLAVWIMDDGSYNKGAIDISCHSFLIQEIKFLKECLKNVFGLRVSYYKDGNRGYRIYFPKKEARALIQIIYPYIIASLRYKIGL